MATVALVGVVVPVAIEAAAVASMPKDLEPGLREMALVVDVAASWEEAVDTQLLEVTQVGKGKAGHHTVCLLWSHSLVDQEVVAATQVRSAAAAAAAAARF